MHTQGEPRADTGDGLNRHHVDWSIYKAAIFDLDGVVTKSANLHAMAWKQTFDTFLKERAAKNGTPFRPFDIVSDYRAYVDGKPRHDGIRSFLHARSIELPAEPSDALTVGPTITDLARQKNAAFLSLVRRGGVDVYPGAIGLIQYLRDHGRRLAVASSSRNCDAVLKAAGLADLFDAQVDGVVADKLHLRGKPAADAFLEAARQLNAMPQETVVIEDSIAGIESARAGQFGLVVGVDRCDKPQRLRACGADIVVADLACLIPESRGASAPGALPSALNGFDVLARRLKDRRVVLFFDYDGTLTPIVARPDLAVLDEAMRSAIRRLADLCPVIVISGRERTDVARLVQLDSIIYAGSHGHDIAGPSGMAIRHEKGREFIPTIHRAAAALKERLHNITGVIVEDKIYAIAVHYRMVDPALICEVERDVDAVLADETGLRKTGGKKVFELRPNVDWDKGRAVLWLLDALCLNGPDVVPIYLGDDATDFDAFDALKTRGVGILVSDVSESTCAHYRLADCGEVRIFLERLAGVLGGGDHG